MRKIISSLRGTGRGTGMRGTRRGMTSCGPLSQPIRARMAKKGEQEMVDRVQDPHLVNHPGACGELAWARSKLRLAKGLRSGAQRGAWCYWKSFTSVLELRLTLNEPDDSPIARLLEELDNFGTQSKSAKPSPVKSEKNICRWEW